MEKVMEEKIYKLVLEMNDKLKNVEVTVNRIESSQKKDYLPVKEMN
jgi:hypothetical protein